MASINETSTEVEFEYMGEGPVPKTVTKVVFHPSVTEVGNDAFRDCFQLHLVVLNEGLQKIDRFAFRNCKSLESIEFPSTLSEVGYGAFGNCFDLREVMLNEGLKKIGHWAFHGCITLQEVVLNEGLQKIGQHAFADCLVLENIKFPKISMRLKAIPNPVQTEVENKINGIPDFVSRGGDISISAAAMRSAENWKTSRESLGRIIGLITCYELKEATTIFDLAMWKSNIDNDSVERPVTKAKIDKSKAANYVDREEFRMEIPEPVKDSVLQYFSYSQDNQG